MIQGIVHIGVHGKPPKPKQHSMGLGFHEEETHRTVPSLKTGSCEFLAIKTDRCIRSCMVQGIRVQGLGGTQRLIPSPFLGHLVLWLGSVIQKSQIHKKGVGYESTGRAKLGFERAWLSPSTCTKRGQNLRFAPQTRVCGHCRSPLKLRQR